MFVPKVTVRSLTRLIGASGRLKIYARSAFTVGSDTNEEPYTLIADTLAMT